MNIIRFTKKSLPYLGLTIPAAFPGGIEVVPTIVAPAPCYVTVGSGYAAISVRTTYLSAWKGYLTANMLFADIRFAT